MFKSLNIGNQRVFHHAHSSIARGVFWLSLFVLAAKFSGALKEVALAARYGTSEVIDAYVFTFSVFTWPSTVWSSALAIMVVPLIARLRLESRTKTQEVQGALLGISLLLGCTLVALLFSIGVLALTSGTIGFPVAAATATQKMMGFLLPLLPLGLLISLYSVWTMAIGRFNNTLLEGLPALAIAAATLFGSGADPIPLVWGTLIGYLAFLTALLLHLAWIHELTWPRWPRLPAYPQFWGTLGVVIIGQLAIGVTPIVDQLMAAHLGTGAIAILGYANRVLSLILSMSALVIARATLPVFSSLRAAGDPLLTKLTFQWGLMLFLLGTVGALVAWWLGPWAVKVLFERGAFTPDNTQDVANVFSYGALQLPFYCAGLVLVSRLAASGRYLEICLISLANVLVKVVANWLLIPVMGLVGISIATVIMYACSLVMILAITIRHPSKVVAGRTRDGAK